MKFLCCIYLNLISTITFCQIIVNKKTQLDSLQNLKEVLIKDDYVKALNEKPGNVTVVDFKPFYNSNITPVQILKQTVGVKIRQEGGYGSRVAFFINGSTGKQIKFFMDGMPMDNMGETQDINNLPVEQIERIEIYKGVLPVDLGADALGGAINIITRKEKQNYLDASYALSSFNTHKFNLSAKKYWNNKVFSSIQLNTGKSKNNYKIEAEIPNQFGNLIKKNVERFHNDYSNYLLKANFGVGNTKWADQFLITLSNSGIKRDIQSNLTMAQPYGEATSAEKLTGVAATYQKINLFKNITLIGNLNLNNVTSSFIDTTKNIYVWDGSIADKRISGAEIGAPTLLKIYTQSFNQKLLTNYYLNPQNKFVLSNTFHQYKRYGKDAFYPNQPPELDFLGHASSMQKNVIGLGYDGAIIKNTIKFSSSVKQFHSKINGFVPIGPNLQVATQTINLMGYNVALSYVFAGFLFKTSYENAVRLPDVEEIFGDPTILLKPNINIVPEKSKNINFNLGYGNPKFSVDFTSFFRRAKNLIYVETNTQGSAKSNNLLEASVAGFETAISLNVIKNVSFNANATYQDIRNKSIIEGRGINNERYFNARLPNIPFLFANCAVAYRNNALLGKKNHFQIWFNTHFTQSYFLFFEVDGDPNLKNRIPKQFTQDVGASININKKINFTLETMNLSNAKVYDNFRAQLPGRSFSFKTRYYITKSINN